MHPLISILHEDDDMIVVNKPCGLATHPGPGCPEKTSCLTQVRKRVAPWIYSVHRLDRATSGVLVFALSEEIARSLSQMFATHQIEKEYRAIVRGHLKDRGTIDKPLAHLTSGKLQDAVTDFECLARAEVPWPVRPYDRARYSLVALRPKTGRTHQLRRHMNTCAHPIIGDTRYGDGAHNRAFRDHIGISRLFLHAHKLTFPHPRSGEIVSFVAAEDSQWQAVTQQLFARMS